MTYININNQITLLHVFNCYYVSVLRHAYDPFLQKELCTLHCTLCTLQNRPLGWGTAEARMAALPRSSLAIFG